MVPPRDLTLGSDTENRICLSGDAEIAARHAVIETADGQLVIRPLDPAAQVRVNGMVLNGQAPLNDRDVITLGDTRLEYQVIRHKMGDTRRRKGSMYRLAIVGVLIILAVEVAFVVFSSILKGQGDPVPVDAGESGEGAAQEVQVAAASAKEQPERADVIETEAAPPPGQVKEPVTEVAVVEKPSEPPAEEADRASQPSCSVRSGDATDADRDAGY